MVLGILEVAAILAFLVLFPYVLAGSIGKWHDDLNGNAARRGPLPRRKKPHAPALRSNLTEGCVVLLTPSAAPGGAGHRQ